MKLATSLVLRLLLLVAMVSATPLLFSQEETTEHGSVEFGGRYVWGEVYGRPDLLPFQPPINTSKFNEYRDLRSGVFIRRMNLKLDDLFDSHKYFHLQSQSSFYRDQSYLATFGSYGRFKIQFRYDETPHTYSNTTRTFYTQTAPGIFTMPLSIRTTLSTIAPSSNVPAVSLAQVAEMSFITPAIRRKNGTALISVNPTAAWNIFFQFSRENQIGIRPISMLFNTSPSTSATSGAGTEVPEAIDYFTNTVKVGTEYGRNNWGFQFSYVRSMFDNNIDQLVFDNPYRTTDANAGPAVGVADLYPSNHADYLNFAGSFKLGKHARFLASISPGWLRQNDPFVPYTSNSVRLAATGPLPATSLDGRKQTLAMNYTLVTKPVKKFQIKAGYRHYDYNDDTPLLEFTPVQGDTGAPGALTEAPHHSYNKKTLELTGNWFFAKRSSVKVGYEGEWFDRTNRDVEHSRENSFITAIDYSPNKDLLFRIGYRHSDRDPEHYEDDLSDGIECEAGELAAARAAFEFPDIHPCGRRFDESSRLRNRGEFLAQYNATDKLSFSGSFTTIQDDYNRPGGTNSATPLNFLTGSSATTNPYYLYGLLKDISFNYTFDANYAIAPQVSFFAEYSREKYHRTMTSRNRSPESTTLSANPNGCGISSNGLAFQGPCDSANNDWYSAARDVVDVFAAGVDLYLGQNVYVTTYYSLAATKGQVFTRALGTQPANFLTQPTRRDGTDTGVLPEDRFIMTTTGSATDYPDTVNRTHEFVALFKFKLKKNILPKIEYRYQQFDYHDYQTSPMTPYVGCVATTGVPAAGGPGGSPSIAAVTATGCPVFGPTAATSFPIPFYPFSAVGDTAAARFYFLGVDQPSYKAHHFSASIEYRF